MSDELDKFTDEELAALTQPTPSPPLPEDDAGDSLSAQDDQGWKKTSDGLRWRTEPYGSQVRVHVLTLDGRTLNVTASVEKIGREKVREHLRSEHR